MRIRMIYLAAGNGRRFCESVKKKTKEAPNKLLCEIDGKPMYLHLLERLERIAKRHPDWELVVVSQYREITDARPEKSVYCEESAQGVSYTIRAGVMGMAAEDRMDRAAPEGACKGMAKERAEEIRRAQGTQMEKPCGVDAAPEAYAFFVADQPYLREETAEAFLTEMERSQAQLGHVVCGNRPGNPTWFAASFREELLALRGDTGGRAVLKRHAPLVRPFEIFDERELSDIDVCSDLHGAGGTTVRGDRGFPMTERDCSEREPQIIDA